MLSGCHADMLPCWRADAGHASMLTPCQAQTVGGPPPKVIIEALPKEDVSYKVTRQVRPLKQAFCSETSSNIQIEKSPQAFGTRLLPQQESHVKSPK